MSHAVSQHVFTSTKSFETWAGVSGGSLQLSPPGVAIAVSDVYAGTDLAL